MNTGRAAALLAGLLLLAGCSLQGTDAPVTVEDGSGAPSHLTAEQVSTVLDQLAVIQAAISADAPVVPPAYAFEGTVVTATRDSSGATCVTVTGLPAGPLRANALAVEPGECPQGRLLWRLAGDTPPVVSL